ncbi:L,D-transpeptidase family protein [Salinimicrobium oceani]|uniref:L,D-transpeptidase family protein n=1 Tax=Salinimicrobium oceani TaxID=2722702 RepID=A0ABX1D015_9FLAO|nr:L,D-transpeptidase family protein [Salinimicrobium oceani]NJW51896.1 L,D-transpeptidase family protein [Salinimicrobium oceani]
MKKNFFYPVIIILITLTACNNDKGEPGSQASSDLASEKIADATPDGIKTEISAKNDIFEGGALEKLYSERQYKSLWRNGDALYSFYNNLKEAEKEGLRFADYHGEELDLLLSSSDLGEDEAARLDLLLSDAFLTYAKHLYFGKLDPTDLNELWGVSRKKKDFSALLKKGVESGDFDSIFEELRPNHEVYKGLKRSLAEYEEIKEDKGPLSNIPEGELIKPGDRDSRLPAIAKRLIALRQFEGDTTALDSVYSEQLVEAVKEFQKSKSIQTDGIIGNSTITELNKGPKDRYLQLLANLERWRWYPRDLGAHYILINIPNFKLAVVKDGDTVREHNVVAGAKERQTPIFSDTLDHLVINPTWTVPPTIKSQDIIPKIAANPGYLRSKNMEVTGPNGERVNPSSVDWSSDEAMSYTFTQVAGPSNPLGRVKIMYPNQYLIYLHDTPAKALFNQTDRAESSGCVRVENAVDLSAYVVNDQSEWTKERIEEIIQTNETTVVKIDQPIQVHHFYWTAWRAGGETVFINDVYELDKKIYSQLTASR